MYKKIAILAVICIMGLFVSALDITKEKKWASEGVKVNPASAAIIAQTGIVASAEYSIAKEISCSAICVVDFEVWNETDTVKLKSQRVWLAANIPYAPKLVYEYPIDQNIKMYLKMGAALTGSVQGSIYLE